MTNAAGLLINRLDRIVDLDENDREGIRALHVTVKSAPPNQLLVQEGATVTECSLLLDGYAFRHKVASTGGRQIISFQVPGDMLDLQHLMLPHADHNVQTLTSATIGWFAASELRKTCERYPKIKTGLWRMSLLDGAIFREWVLNVGRRNAKARVAHIICEFAVRREAAGLASAESFELPMTQEQIGDATGLTSVHVNRMLAELVAEKLLQRDKRSIQISDWTRLREVADFNPRYLHH